MSMLNPDAASTGLLRLNVVANYGAKFWSICSVYIFVPVYIHLLGVESYGLIAFYSVALAILFVADAGLASTFGREAAHETDRKRLLDLLASLEVLLFALVGATGLAVFLSAEWIGQHWLNKASELGGGVTVDSIRLMACALVPQIAMSIYFGGLMGLQRQVRANVITVLFGLIRSGLVILPLFLIRDVRVFFAWQAVTSWIFLFVMRSALRTALGATPQASGTYSWPLVKPMLGYAGGMFVMALIAGLNNQVDRLVVSKLLPLADFTFYSLAAMLAQIPTIATIPIAMAVSPKLIALCKQPQPGMLRASYESFSFGIATFGSAAAFGLFFFGSDIVGLWLRGQVVPSYMSPVIQILAIGSLFLSLQLMPYYLSLANGHTRTNVQLGLVALVVTIPAQLWLTARFGAVGAAWPWLGLNLFAFIYLGIALNHRFNRGHGWQWFLYCTMPPVALSALVFLSAKFIAVSLALVGFPAVVVGAIAAVICLLLGFTLWRKIAVVLYPRATIAEEGK